MRCVLVRSKDLSRLYVAPRRWSLVDTTVVTGTFVADAGATGPTGLGMLRVITNPSVPAQILVDGIPRDTWGLNWVKMDPGTYERIV